MHDLTAIQQDTTVVNTRTVSLPLDVPSPSDLYNHTLVPILDFANHSSAPDRTAHKSRQITIPRVRYLMTPDKMGSKLIAPPSRRFAEGEEVLFEYGRHSNDLFLAEYGFIGSSEHHAEVDRTLE